MNKKELFIQQIIETVLYFREMYEENNDGKTSAIELLKPVKTITNVAVRKFVLYELLRKQKLSFTEVAVQFAKWSFQCESFDSFDIEDVALEIRSICLEHEREIQIIPEIERQIQRSYMRAARYFERIFTVNAPAHSRIVELFIHEAFVPRGFGKNGSGHREHVVPCAALRDESIRRYKNGAEVKQIAEFLRRHVVIVEITKDQHKYLDSSIKSGGLGLRDSMPVGWQFEKGDIFQRLHDARIEFDPPPKISKNSTKIYSPFA